MNFEDPSNLDGEEQQSNDLNSSVSSRYNNNRVSAFGIWRKTRFLFRWIEEQSTGVNRTSTLRLSCLCKWFQKAISTRQSRHSFRRNESNHWRSGRNLTAENSARCICVNIQWRRLPPPERERYEERARERAREQEPPLANNFVNYDTAIHPQRIVNGGVMVNGYYPSAFDL